MKKSITLEAFSDAEFFAVGHMLVKFPEHVKVKMVENQLRLFADHPIYFLLLGQWCVRMEQYSANY
jgi:hypothetical protein